MYANDENCATATLLKMNEIQQLSTVSKYCLKCQSNPIIIKFSSKVCSNWRTENTRLVTMKMQNDTACNFGGRRRTTLVFCFCSLPFTFSAAG
jgi:hypothetical protein